MMLSTIDHARIKDTIFLFTLRIPVRHADSIFTYSNYFVTNFSLQFCPCETQKLFPRNIFQGYAMSYSRTSSNFVPSFFLFQYPRIQTKNSSRKTKKRRKEADVTFSVPTKTYRKCFVLKLF